MSPSKTLFFLCLSFIVGIFASSEIKIPQYFVLGFLFVGLLLVILSLFPRKNTAIFGFCFLFLALGIIRFEISEFYISNDKLSRFIGKGEISFIGIISGEPDVRDNSQKLVIEAGGSSTLITTKIYPEYQYLDKVRVTGKVDTPMVTESFNYKDYLLKDGIYSVMGFPNIQIISKDHQYNIWSFAYEKILFLKQRLERGINDNFLPPHNLLLEGIIFGNNKNMTQDLRDKLNLAGVRFLTAISGVHVIILSSILVSLLLFLGLSRKYATGLSIVIIWLYVALTGFSASGIRAATMGSSLILAEILGRQNTSSRTIVLAASLMLLENPLLLNYDVGFQLSFMASLGIIYLKPLARNMLENLFKGKFKELLDIVSVTFAAQIFTLPIMIYSFGNISLSAPFTNLLILPVMPWILSFGFLFAIASSVSSILGWIFYVPIWVLSSYFLKVVDIFSKPWMAKDISGVSWIWVLISYLIIGFATWALNKKFSKDFL